MEQGPATVVDVSYGGCRLRFQPGTDVPLASSLSLPVPTSDAPVPGTLVWRQSALDGDVIGVAVAGPQNTGGAWCSFVNGLTSRV